MQSLRDKVAQIYYTHGLFCASHPYFIIVSVVCIFIFACYPLSSLPLSGNTPLKHDLSLAEFKKFPPTDNPKHVKRKSFEEELKRPRWVFGQPISHIQQIVVTAKVSPWLPKQHIPTDAFRPTLAKVFDILEHVHHAKIIDSHGEMSLSDLCLRVAEPVKWINFRQILPHYSCLVVSPGNFWIQDKERYNKDAEIIKTVYRKFGQGIESSPTLKDVLFGIPWIQTGVSRYFIRNRQRTISFAITIAMKNYSASFVDSLKKELEQLYPDKSKNSSSDDSNVVFLHYPDVNYFVEYTPLLVTYFVILMYLYFSVRKIDMVKSKIGLAISAVFTVIASLLMSVRVCSAFGLTSTLSGGEIFPYLVVLIGVENVLVITKSVVSTPVHLEVKVRVAQGLSKEGWSITKNLLTELLIIFVGFFTFVPAIQEFSLFAAVGLLTDFFLQIVFFATTLSVDIRRMELADLHKQSAQRTVEEEINIEIEPLIRCPVMSRMTPPSSPPSSRIHRSKSAPRLNFQEMNFRGRFSPPSSSHLADVDMFFPDNFNGPRRLKFFFFWARTRMFQRLIMICTVIWIGLIVYKTGIVDKLTGPDGVTVGDGDQRHMFKERLLVDKIKAGENLYTVTDGLGEEVFQVTGRAGEEDDSSGHQEHKNLESYMQLSRQHWPTLFGYYNISLAGRYISILPPIHLSILVDPQQAIEMRHPAERDYYAHPGLDGEGHTHPIKDSNDTELTDHVPYYMYNPEHLKTFYPKSKKEFFITLCLAFLSVIIISYFMMILYKCMCSRNYSKWRRSWTRGKKKSKVYYKQIKESVPLVLKGHDQKIECLVTDGHLVVSSCWGGQLRVWDSNTGECLSATRRRSFTPPQCRKPCLGRNIEDSDADLYAEYHGDSSFSDLNDSYEITDRRPMLDRSSVSSSAFDDLHPDLSSTINTQFSSIDPSPLSSPGRPFDFRQWFEGVYEEHRRMMKDNVRERRVSSGLDSRSRLAAADDSISNMSWSAGDACRACDPLDESQLLYDSSTAIWCLSCQEGYIVAGCGNGRIEVWEADGVVLKGQYDKGRSAVTGISLYNKRIVAARLDGSLDFLDIETFLNPVSSPALPATPPKQVRAAGHTRALSSGSAFSGEIKLWDTILHCTCIQTHRAHQQPINVLKSDGGRVVTGSQDHTLKVFRQEDCSCLYTLYGHVGSVTALYLDKGAMNTAVSGSVEGDIRMWDLLTGLCIHKFKGHDSTIMSLDCSSVYIVSLGLDDRLSVWDRNRGHLVHSVDMEGAYSSCLISLTNNLFLTGGQGCLYLWDISKGDLMRRISLDDSEQASFVNHLCVISDMGVVCDTGVDLKVIKFPTILEKFE